MKYMTAVVALAAVAVAAPVEVEVEKRNNTCPNTANVACCSIPLPILGNLLCNVVQPGGGCSSYSYCCNNQGSGGLINVNLGNCMKLF